MIGCKIYKKKICVNSLDWARENIKTAPHGAVFLSDTHEVARGRDGRLWQQYPGQLLVTVLLKPGFGSLTNLNMALTLGILQPLKKYGVGLKWPNDFILNNKKVGGMILESVWSGDELEGVILGFGLNVNNVFDSKDELSKIATSLVAHTKKQIDIEDLLKKLLVSLNVYCDKEVYKEWKSNQIYLNKKITVHKKDGTVVCGIAKDFLPNGDLVLCAGEKEEIIPFYVVTSVTSVPK
jgi:BirA family transcriptional regulator, biotin operon repressor / biotin---[acetyl-CoA-carboxylase] ligase